MNNSDKFRISSYLKDIIGRDLVTNEYVAIFELVKNSFDAKASKVNIEFEPDQCRIFISDNGHGVSSSDIRNKWLFVAYSEKAEIQPDDYRDKIRRGGQVAGNKGIGRFACDTLGKRLSLYSKTSLNDEVSKLQVDWTLFEQDSHEEFHTINVDLGVVTEFPLMTYADPPQTSGTVLVIEQVRHQWDLMPKLTGNLCRRTQG